MKFWNKPNVAPRLGYREQVVALWTKNPKLTTRQVMKQTGAPYAVVLKQRRELVEAGVLKSGGSKWL